MNKTPTILVISESHEQFASTASLLRNDGFRVRFENDVNNSVMLAGDNPPHLIISELAAPNVDGLKLCRRVQKDHNLGTPVLLVGDLAINSSIVEDGFRCGAADYIQRPIDPLRLADICRDILQRKMKEWAESIETPDDDLSSIGAFDNHNPNLDILLKSESLRIALFENSRAGLALFSASGQLIESNATLRHMFDYSQNELFGMKLSDFFFPYDITTGKRALKEMIAGTQNYYQCRNGYLTLTDERIWGGLTIIAISDTDAGSRQLIGIFDDPASPSHESSNTTKWNSLVRSGHPNILDLTQWKLDTGLICEN